MALSLLKRTKKQTSLIAGTGTGATNNPGTITRTGALCPRPRAEPTRINTLSRLKDLFDDAEALERSEATPAPAPRTTAARIKFSEDFAGGSTKPGPLSEDSSQLPFPNQNYKPRKTILKNRVMSRCSSLYACYDKSDFNDLITNHNTIANSGNVMLRRMHKALAVKIMRRRSLGIRDGQAKQQKSLPFEISSSDIFGGKIPSVQNTNEKPPLLGFPVIGPGHSPDAALVEQAGKPEHPDEADENHEALKELLKRAEALEHHKRLHFRPKQTSHKTTSHPHKAKLPFSGHEKPKPAPPSKPKPPLTRALVARNGSMRLTEREDTSQLFGPPPTDSFKRSASMEAWYQYPKIDFDHTDWQTLTRYAMRYAKACAAQELQFQIPAALHAKKMEEYAQKADEELQKVHYKIDPPKKFKNVRKLGDSVTDPFGIKKYKKLLLENAKSGNGVLKVEMPELFSKIHDPDPPREKYEPKQQTVKKVNHWLETSVLGNIRKPLLWVQPVLTKFKKDVEKTLAVRKFFNVVEGSVVYPFYDTTAANSFAKRHTPDKNPLNPLVKDPIPADRFYATLPLKGYQNNEITFEYMTNTIYVTARTLTKYGLERGKRLYEGSVEIPEDFIISDFEYSRDQHGTLFIEELPEEEKHLIEDANHLYAHESQSIHKIYT